MPNSCLHAEIQSGLAMHIACCLKYYEFIYAVILLCPEDTVSLQLLTASGSCLFHACAFTMILEFLEDVVMCVYSIQGRKVWSLLFSACCPVIHLYGHCDQFSSVAVLLFIVEPLVSSSMDSVCRSLGVGFEGDRQFQSGKISLFSE